MKLLNYSQPLWALTFKAIIVVHCFEIAYAWIRGMQLGLNGTTICKWLVNVAFNGIFATRMLIDPEKYGAKKPKKK